MFLLSTLVLIWIIIAFNLLIIFSLLFINRKASAAESQNSKSQSRTSSKVSKSKAESPDVTMTEEEEQAYAEWEAMDKRDCALLENNSQVNEDQEPFHFKWRSTYHFVPLPQ